MKNRRYRIGIDVGGTFTDGILFHEEEKKLYYSKVPSTPLDPSLGFLDNLKLLLGRGRVSPEEICFFVHGTTVATNAIIEGKTAKTALIITRGFKDILEIAFQIRPKLYNLSVKKPPPLVPRDLCLEVTERMGPKGEVLIPLLMSDLVSIIETIKKEGVESIAVCLLHSYSNNRHEKCIKEELVRAFPHLPITLSSEICPEFREYVRCSTTVINSAIRPVVANYLQRIDEGLKERGIPVHCHIMQSNGGIFHWSQAMEEPCRMIESGPAAGVIVASFIAKNTGKRDAICIDIGGTTAKIGLIFNGTPKIAEELQVGSAAFGQTTANRASGYPLKTPAIDLVEIGAGGGSISWVDSGGILRVGPKSAGANPGPACYPQGGEEPTLTDANLVLGRLNPHYFIGGTIPLDVERAYRAVDRHLGAQFGESPVITASAIIDVAISNMVSAMRFVSVERGYDPRDFSLIATGGCGPLHANLLAKELEIPMVIVPPNPGLASALGLLVTDILQEVSQTVLMLEDLTIETIEEIVLQLSEKGRGLLEDQGVKRESIMLIPSLDLRYRGQSYELNLKVDLELLKREGLFLLHQLFHEEHLRAYGFFVEGEEIKIVNIKVMAIGYIPKYESVPMEKKENRIIVEKERREVYFHGEGFVECPIYERQTLSPGTILSGPTIVEEYDSTTLIIPNYQGIVDFFGNIRITKRESTCEESVAG